MGEVIEIPLYKKLWSYIKSVPLEKSQSPYNPELHIILEKGELQLCTADAIYSFGKKYYNFREAFKLLRIEKRNINKVLVLGLGLGSIPQILEEIYKANYSYTLVEIDEAVIDLADRYVLNKLDVPIEYVATDAFAFVAMDEKKYDLIAMDIFQGCIIPDKFQTKQFLRDLKNSLNPNGVLIYNRLAIDEENDVWNEEFYEKFQKVFPDSSYVDIRYNRVFFSTDVT